MIHLIIGIIISLLVTYLFIKKVSNKNIFYKENNILIYIIGIFIYFCLLIYININIGFNYVKNSIYLTYLLILIEENIKLIVFYKKQYQIKIGANINKEILLKDSLFFVSIFAILESIIYFLFNKIYFINNLFYLYTIRFGLNIFLHLLYSYLIINFFYKKNFITGLLTISLIHLFINYFLSLI